MALHPGGQVITRGSDQTTLSTRHASRDDRGVTRSYGLLLEEVVSTVPDGVVCFFVSYQYLEQTVAIWLEQGIMSRIQKHKLVFIETQVRCGAGQRLPDTNQSEPSSSHPLQLARHFCAHNS